MHRVFSPALLACVGEARVPDPRELAALADRIHREAFPHDASMAHWERSWCLACAALGGTAAPDCDGPALTAEMIMTYQVSLTTGGGTTLDAEVHASATAALARVRELNAAGTDVTIMGPYGEKLGKNDLAELASAEARGE